MKKQVFSNLELKDWYVIVSLLVLVFLTIGIGSYSIYVFDTFKDIEARHNYAIHLRALALTCTVVFPVLTLIALYFFIKITRKRNRLIIKEKESRLALEQNYALMHDFYENTPIGFHSIDIEGNILDINNIELEWLGYKREEVVGKMNFEEITVRNTENLQELFGELVRTGKLNNLEGTFIRKDGSLIPIMTNSRLIYNEKGQIDNIKVAVMNFSEKRKIDDQLKRAKEIAEQSSLLKDQFVANVSHEIRTPLNAILSFSKLLERTPLNERQKEFASSIHNGSKNLLTIINDILDFSKIEAGVLRVEKTPFNPRNVIDTVVHMFSYKAEEKKIAFDIKVSDEIPEVIVGDASRLTQILVNLLGNAFKFTDKGKVLLDISMVQKGNDSVRLLFKVQDTGIGIPSAKLNKIFKRFGQVSTDSTRRFGGAGLGLTITKQLVELQKGSIQVESVFGEGSSFMIEISYGMGMLEEQASDELFKLTPNKEMAILVAEDNPTNRRIFELQFDNWGFTADFAVNGQVAVDMFREKTYDIVLMDIQMPEMDGYTATQVIRQELKSTIPIIAITAHAFRGEREKCISYGMNDYLTKPIKEKELFDLLKRYLPDVFHENEKAIKPKLASEADFDRKYIFALTRGNKDLLSELAILTIQQSALEIQEIEDALHQENYTNIAASAHSMRSTVLNMGFNKLMGQTLIDLGEEVTKELPNQLIVSGLFTQLKELREHAVEFLSLEFL